MFRTLGQRRSLGAPLLVVVTLFLGAHPTHGLPRYGPLELSGNIAAQQLLRNSNPEHFSWVQQRNTLKFRIDYQLLQHGQLMEFADVPVIDDAKLFMLYRGVYDSIYDIAPSFQQRDIYGHKTGLRLTDVHGRNDVKYENRLREAYVDVSLKQLPLSFRLGRQQIVWGETDNFRMLDRVNALDLSWHLQQETWDELRIPYWMIKGLWNLDQVGPLSGSFVEFYWNPGDWYPAKEVFLPQPWSAPITNPLSAIATKGQTLYHGTTLSNQGDYTRNPQENSQVGVRFSAVTPQGVQFTLNYFYQRWSGNDDGTDAATIKGIRDTNEWPGIVARNELPIEVIAPYVHTTGLSLNYAEEQYTQTVFRMETIYEMGVPFNDASKPLPKKPPFALLGLDVFDVSKRDMWKGMIAFDRPTWIRPLNRKATFLVLGQFFWHYLLDNPGITCKFPNSPGRPCGGSANPQTGGFRGTFSTSGLTTGGAPVIDKVRDWELLTTLAMTTFYRGGKLVPFLIYVLDPVNKFNMEVIWMADYFVTNDLILSLSQRYFINTTEAPVYETWGVGGLNRGRSETGLRVTYQF